MDKKSTETSKKIEEADDLVQQHKRKSEKNVQEVKKKATEVTDLAAKKTRKA